jgi:hypothetical protein
MTRAPPNALAHVANKAAALVGGVVVKAAVAAVGAAVGSAVFNYRVGAQDDDGAAMERVLNDKQQRYAVSPIFFSIYNICLSLPGLCRRWSRPRWNR